jgi:transcriptional regulator with XRE-family HTH domain
MTVTPLDGEVVPEWTLADRLRKARLHAGLEQADLAREIGIGRSTIVNYEAGKTEPSRPVLLSWALRCGVSFEWLAETAPFPRGGLRAQARHSSGLTRTRALRRVLRLAA